MDGKNSIFVVMPIVIMLCLIILVALPVIAARPPRHPDAGRVQFRHDDAATPPQAGGRPPGAQLPRDSSTPPANPP